MKTYTLAVAIVAGSFLLGVAQPAAATTEIEKTYSFALDEWHAVELEDGPLTVYRMHIDRKEGRVTKASIIRPYNSEFLDTLRVQLEYTNESSNAWKARVTLRWLDADGQVIDGFSANEKLASKKARGIVSFSVPTLRYGLEQAETLEMTIHVQP